MPILGNSNCEVSPVFFAQEAVWAGYRLQVQGARSWIASLCENLRRHSLALTLATSGALSRACAAGLFFALRHPESSLSGVTEGR
jgi:hypothetical protein